MAGSQWAMAHARLLASLEASWVARRRFNRYADELVAEATPNRAAAVEGATATGGAAAKAHAVPDAANAVQVTLVVEPEGSVVVKLIVAPRIIDPAAGAEGPRTAQRTATA